MIFICYQNFIRCFYLAVFYEYLANAVKHSYVPFCSPLGGKHLELMWNIFLYWKTSSALGSDYSMLSLTRIGQRCLVFFWLCLIFWFRNRCQNRTLCLEKLSLVLPERPPYFPRQFGRCAVIGNSGDLLKTKFGKEIDGYDAVVRENGAPIQVLYC